MYAFVINVKKEYRRILGYKAAIFRTNSYTEWQDALCSASEDHRIQRIFPEVNESKVGENGLPEGWEFFKDYLG